MNEISSELNFINHTGEPITWTMVMESDIEEIEAISSDDRIVLIVNATSIGVGAAGTGESGLRNESIWFKVVEQHVKGAYTGIIAARQLIEKEKTYRITNSISHKRWYEGMIATLTVMAVDIETYNEAQETGYYSYFDMQHTDD